MLAALGAQYVGAVLVPVNTRYRGHEAADVVARTRARILVVGQGFLGGDQIGLLRTAAAEGAGGPDAGAGPVPGLPDLETVVSLGTGEPPAGAVPWERFVAGGAHVDPARVEKLADAVTPDDVADILFTSGTTGRSKGAVSAHRQTLGAAGVWAGLAAVTADDRYLVASPFFHSFGSKAGYLVSLLTGAATIPVAVFDTGTVLDLVERERVTLLPGAPTVYQSMLDDPSLPGRDLRSLRLAVTGAATVPQVARRADAHRPRVRRRPHRLRPHRGGRRHDVRAGRRPAHGRDDERPRGQRRGGRHPNPGRRPRRPG